MHTWILFVQNERETVDLKRARFATHDDAIREAKRLAPMASRGISCVGARRADVARPDAADRDRILMDKEEEEEEAKKKKKGNGELTPERRAFGIEMLKRLLKLSTDKKKLNDN